MADKAKETNKKLISYSWNISQMNGDQLRVDLILGQPLFIVGANGSGKSAMVQRLTSELSSEGIDIVRYTAHREPWIVEDPVLQNSAKQKEIIEKIKQKEIHRNFRWDLTNDHEKYRYYFHKLIDIKNKHDQDITSLIGQAGYDHEKIIATREKNQKVDPINLCNSLLKEGNLLIELKFNKVMNGLVARDMKNNTEFSMRELSDGERSAAIFAATAITVPKESVILIDEPELHLHPHILDSFFRGLVDYRKDCIFVFSTHNIDFVCSFPEAQVLAVRSCEWTRDLSSSFDVEIVEGGVFSENIKLGILGPRKKVLYPD